MAANRALVAALMVAAFSATAPVASAAPTTELVSVTSHEAQVAVGSAPSWGTAISQDGGFVLFRSEAAVLAPGDGPGTDLFVRDRRRGVTRTVTDSVGGYEPSISAHGRYVAFMSFETTNVRGDTNGAHDVFVSDMRRGITTRLMTPGGRQVDHRGAQGPTLSADGRFLVFVSDSPLWVRGDTNGTWDVFLHDRRTGTTRLISEALDGGPANKDSTPAMLAANGRHVAFWSRATNLVRGDHNDRPDLFVHDRVSGRTMRATVSSTGEEAQFPSRGSVWREGSISANGRRVAFVSRAANLVPGDSNRRHDVFVHDLRQHETRRVSVTSAGDEVCQELPSIGDSCGSYGARMSADGRRVAFTSEATDLVAGDSNATSDVFVHDLRARETTRVSVDASGGQVCERRRWELCNNGPSISGDGRFVAFASWAADVVPGDTNGAQDVFVRGPL